MVCSIRQSAMRDPAVFADPDTFDVRRGTDKTLAFGSGPHFCLGAALAHLEGEVALDTLPRRFPQMTLAGDPGRSPAVGSAGIPCRRRAGRAVWAPARRRRRVDPNRVR